MTTQEHKLPKTNFLCRVTNDNYDFLYLVARNWDMSLGAVLNLFLARARQESGINALQQSSTVHNMKEHSHV